MNKSINWQQWLSIPNKPSVFFMLNSLAKPNPVALFYSNDWVEQAFPLYSNTPMDHMLTQSPWLVQPKSGCLSVIGHLLDNHPPSNNSWGWAYRSDESWIQQLNHWRSRQQVILQEKQVLLRSMDARILSQLLPVMIVSDWSGFLTPVCELMIDTPEPQIYCRPENCGHGGSEQPFVLGPHLLEAWFHSDYALQGQVFVLISDLWENHGELAEKLNKPEGKLQERIIDWLKSRLESGGSISHLTNADYLQTLDEQYTAIK
ncbi:DUF4123 domain-containing protein [Photorhabdus bodei]|uniref:DUF4123 domain-containing protein n=1 Tax=Photorhabdus bodei TaxID=2029681 RepID=A0A329X879_9GAMM|nr:DUF4123 domain-containing protein [Photorhabdus bodei]NDK99951.1 DUF4123 domain-containing protein [Photorhabdus bodei]NDL04145.1 DUF4123 domain-containing protein [Photorhabdus bodei]NDL08195.1 DUF4123 domain-containing protein [Photorhabdus bodei]RAX12180.1 hypothetical protein CKY02_12120 [Photorhabdus bodei]